MLLQNPTGKCDQPIAYAFRLLNNVKKNYTTTKREALVTVCAFHKFWYYLLGNMHVCFLRGAHGIVVFCEKTSTIKMNCKVVILRLWLFDGVQNWVLSFYGGCCFSAFKCHQKFGDSLPNYWCIFICTSTEMVIKGTCLHLH